ncbi:hypothetical protein MNBD_GAMMA16-918 [hydrothermal vent metagenome]|uniref:Uncharacterized protein n=1 Tax=hydrothermal vent metagenome TaxID=652676 RepID=A0A3B0ZXN4_9ZZZZ
MQIETINVLNNRWSIRGLLFLLIVCFALAGCSTQPKVMFTLHSHSAYIPEQGKSELHRFAPVIVTPDDHAHNRIGKVVATRISKKKNSISINPDTPVFYTSEQEFHTETQTYRNLIYRFHFSSVPFSVMPFYLTSGKNVGLMVIVTLDELSRPVLITTVHTCGCYFAITPTNFLAQSALPDNWTSKQTIFGETLPGIIGFPTMDTHEIKPVIYLRADTHRVMDISAEHIQTLNNLYRAQTINFMPIEALKQLPLGNGTSTSFYHDSGFHQGYVKEAFKPWEFLLMSWWALDWHIGSDKEYGPKEKTGTVFYTSLKPWAREQSDLWKFEQFLRYWGWKL